MCGGRDERDAAAMSVTWAYFALHFSFIVGSSASTFRSDSGRTLRQAVAVDGSGEPIRLGDPGAIAERCLCQALELLRSPGAGPGLVRAIPIRRRGVLLYR